MCSPPQHQSFLEDLSSGHTDVCEALQGRLQLMAGIQQLWRAGKGLQAATNAVRGCFSEDLYDVALFCDILECFITFK